MLEQFLVTQLFAFLMIFARIGSGIMLIPGIGEAYVAVRIRLLLALMISLLLTPLYTDIMPPVPGSPLMLLILLIAEIMAGLFIGAVCRLLMSVMHTVGMIISYQSSLAAASMFDINQATQGTVIGNFLSVTALIVLFTTNLHHLILQGLADSYSLFKPGVFPIVGDMANYMSSLLSKGFMMAVKLSTPFIVLGLLFNLGAGMLARLMPTMQVFFVLTAPQIVMNFIVLTLVLSAIMLWYMTFYRDTIGAFLSP